MQKSADEELAIGRADSRVGFKANRFDAARPPVSSVGVKHKHEARAGQSGSSAVGSSCRSEAKSETGDTLHPTHGSPMPMPLPLPLSLYSPLPLLPHPSKRAQRRAARTVEQSRAGGHPTALPPRAIEPVSVAVKKQRTAGRSFVRAFENRPFSAQIRYPSFTSKFPLSPPLHKLRAPVGYDLRRPRQLLHCLRHRTEVAHLTPLTRIPTTTLLGYPASALQSIDKSKFSAEATAQPDLTSVAGHPYTARLRERADKSFIFSSIPIHRLLEVG